MNKYLKSSDEALEYLRNQKINTWFDLGIFIDKFKEELPVPTFTFRGKYEDCMHQLSKGSMAFITFLYSIDGVTIEVEKYAKIFKDLIPGIGLHYITGKLYPEAYELIDPAAKSIEIPEIAGFDDWPLYNDFFFTKLERGSKEYNQLIIKYWNEVLTIVEKLGRYIEENNIKLLYLINVCSNPGNMSLALATVLISELMGIPVLNNNHDFYWEGGNSEVNIQHKGLKKGPRDFFFTNAHLGEVFSLIEVLYPWQSRIWMNININRDQSKHLIAVNGHNPANVTEIGTAVDTSEYVNISKRQKINAFHQFERILSRYKKTLICYSVDDVIDNELVDINNTRPILIGNKTKQISKFLSENIIFLQPTRIISRKRIELGLRLIKEIFAKPEFAERLKNTPNLKLTILVTGPIANGHYQYFQHLIKKFAKLLSGFDEVLQKKIFMAFLFSELDREDFKNRFENPVGIPDLYNIASLVLLPSKTEGRGLPIIEATACGTPILCRRYIPENVYSEVIGEHLPEKKRLKVIEFDGKKITGQHANKIINRVLFPHLYTNEVIHNKKAVQSRFSLSSLKKNIEKICKSMHYQISDNQVNIEKTESLLEWYENMVSYKSDTLTNILNTTKRSYIPGHGKLAFMRQLKSLIDPSAFRNEEQQNRGFIHYFAVHLVDFYTSKKKVDKTSIHNFYNAVDNIFCIRKGETPIRHDHSFSYRHRNNNYYPYQDYTIEELTGLVNMLFQEYISPIIKTEIDEVSHFFTDLDLALAQLTSSPYLSIDHRKKLIKKLQTNLTFGLFPGDYTKYELEFIILQAIRSRLGLRIEEELTEEFIIENKSGLKTAYVFANQWSMGNWFSKEEITDYINNNKEPELKLLHKHGIVKIINSRQVSIGLHFPQMGEDTLAALNDIHNDGGFIVANRSYAPLMADIIDIDCIHIGRAHNEMIAQFMGVPINSGFIQFVPAGIRTTLAYPTPVQTAKSFDHILNKPSTKKLISSIGENEFWSLVKKESENTGATLEEIVKKLSSTNTEDKAVLVNRVNGLYSDRMPWSGVYAKALTGNSKFNWNFKALTSKDKTKTVTQFVSDFEKTNKHKVEIAWNGGYILNPELVGKLGLPESYIGSPLGLIMQDGEILSPPLFNKAAFLIDTKGNVSIRKVCCKGAMSFKLSGKLFELNDEDINSDKPGNKVVCYNLMHSSETIENKNRYIVRLAGRTIKEIIEPEAGGSVKIIPVGLTLSIPKEVFPEGAQVGDKVAIKIDSLSDIKHAIEAGPHLIDNGNVILNMDEEGWTHHNSIRTQAARLDYTDMRGPKIAIGIDADSNLYVLTINGRIRESVGATHFDMAEILIKQGIVSAMGFDPGGSSTLVVNGITLNISPYNKAYETNIYALPPEPRAVSNAVIGYLE